MHFKRSFWKPTENNLKLARFWRFPSRERPFSQSSKYICLPFVFLLEKINIFKVYLIFKFHLVLRLNMAGSLTASFHVKKITWSFRFVAFHFNFLKVEVEKWSKSQSEIPSSVAYIVSQAYCRWRQVLRALIAAGNPKYISDWNST